MESKSEGQHCRTYTKNAYDDSLLINSLLDKNITHFQSCILKCRILTVRLNDDEPMMNDDDDDSDDDVYILVL